MFSHIYMPREGHLQQLYHIFAYLRQHHNSILVFDPTYTVIDTDDFEVQYWIHFCVCVLTGLRTEQYDRIIIWWSSKLQSGIDQFLDSSAYCYEILPHCSCYSSPRQSYHMISSAHLGVSHIRLSISACHTNSFVHLGVSCVHPSITTSHPETPPPAGSYCMTLSSNCLLLLDSREIPAKMVRIFPLSHIGSTTPPSCINTPRSPSALHTLRIVVITPPTVLQLLSVSLYRSSLTAFLPFPSLLRSRVYPTSRLLSDALSYP